MRLSFMLAAALLLPGMAAAAECTTPAEDIAFAIVGLRNEMMVTALTCNAQPQYNVMMSKFGPGISAQEKVLDQHFQRINGRGASKAHDTYITQLANDQSDEGLKDAGNQICRRNLPMFDEIGYLHDLPELATYAQSKGIVDPPNACATPATVVRHPSRKSGHKTKR